MDAQHCIISGDRYKTVHACQPVWLQLTLIDTENEIYVVDVTVGLVQRALVNADV